MIDVVIGWKDETPKDAFKRGEKLGRAKERKALWRWLKARKLVTREAYGLFNELEKRHFHRSRNDAKLMKREQR